MLELDLKQLKNCPKDGVKVFVYGIPWKALLMFSAEAGPVRNRAELQSYFDALVERLRCPIATLSPLSSFPPEVDVPLPLAFGVIPVVAFGSAPGFAELAAGPPVVDPRPLGLPCAQAKLPSTKLMMIATILMAYLTAEVPDSFLSAGR